MSWSCPTLSRCAVSAHPGSSPARPPTSQTALFFLAFPPQFVDPDVGPAWAQLAALGLLFVLAAAVFDSCWALAGSGLSGVLRRVRLAVLDRISAGIYASLAVLTLTARRATA